MKSRPDSAPDATRRTLITKAAYVVPVILSLQAAPEYAKAGSVKPGPSGSKGPPSWVPGPPPWSPRG